MAGLSLILETRNVGGSESTRQVINKATVMVTGHHAPPSTTSSLTSPPSRRRNSPFQTPTFLDRCFLCGQKLLPGKDIYMYGGDKGFCSVECRCSQMFMDEEERVLEGNCSLAAMKPEESAAAPPSPSQAASRRRKAAGNHAGGFAY